MWSVASFGHCYGDATFVAYTSSVLEQQWLDNVAKWQHDVCAHTSNATMKQLLDAVQGDVSSVVTRNATMLHDTLSYFTYALRDAQFLHVPIEPTMSLARDPRKCWNIWSEDYVQSKAYLLPLSESLCRTSYHQRPILIDAGAGPWAGKVPFPTLLGNPLEPEPSDFGTSWIWDWYRRHDIDFDQIFAWEPRKPEWNVSGDEAHPLALFYRALHFYNTKVTNEDGGIDNPLTTVRKMCKGVGRVCVFKLDIDSPVLEGKLLEAFLSNRSLTEVVDEFYVEKHIRNGAMKMHGMGTDRRFSPGVNDLSHWYTTVTNARKKGLRMHFWP